MSSYAKKRIATFPGKVRRKVKRELRKHGFRVNPSRKQNFVGRTLAAMESAKSRQVFVQCQKGEGTWKTIAMVRDTPEMRELAKRFARTYKKKHPKEIVRVITE